MEKIIIFDNDGVIVDTEPYHEIITLAFLKECKYKITGVDYLQLVGGNFNMTYKYIKDNYPDFYASVEDMTEDFLVYLAGSYPNYLEIKMDNVQETVEILSKKGYRLFVASSGRYEKIEEVLRTLGIRDYFEFIVSGYDFKESKPNPEIYLHCAQRIGVKPEDCFVIEDSTYGIAAAKAAGMKVIAKRDERYNFKQDIADYLIDDLSEIVEIVEKYER